MTHRPPNHPGHQKFPNLPSAPNCHVIPGGFHGWPCSGFQEGNKFDPQELYTLLRSFVHPQISLPWLDANAHIHSTAYSQCIQCGTLFSCENSAGRQSDLSKWGIVNQAQESISWEATGEPWQQEVIHNEFRNVTPQHHHAYIPFLLAILSRLTCHLHPTSPNIEEQSPNHEAFHASCNLDFHKIKHSIINHVISFLSIA